MRIIGIRANPNEITYSIVEKTEHQISIILADKLIIPKSLYVPEQLKYVRNTIIDIIFQNFVTIAGIRVSESNAKSPSIERINFEAIIQELFASSSIEKYFIGQISTISSKLSFPRENFKKYISNELEYDKVTNWKNYSDKEKESILVALSALNL